MVVKLLLYKIMQLSVIMVIGFIIANITVSLGAMIFVVPLAAVHFKYVSIASPVTSLLVSWAVAAAFFIGIAAIIIGFIFTPAGCVIAWAGGLAVKYTLAVVNWIGSSTFASIYTVNNAVVFWLLYAGVVIALPVILKKGAARVYVLSCVCAAALAAMLFTSYLSSEGGDMDVAVLDVGQGQCIIVTSGMSTAVIDCGSTSGERSGTLAAQYIRGLGRNCVDVLVLTHYHADHVNGVSELMQTLSVGAVVLPEIAAEDGEYADEIIEIAQKREIEVIFAENEMSVSFDSSEMRIYPPLGN